jgi:hypothetical protein
VLGVLKVKREENEMTDEYLDYVDELPWDNPPDEVVWMFVRYLRRYAEDLMAPNGPGLTPDDKARVKRALKILSRKVNKFIKSFLDPNRLENPSEAARGCEMLHDMFEAVFTIAAPTSIMEGLSDFYEKEQARKTREKLSEMGKQSGIKRREERKWVKPVENSVKGMLAKNPALSAPQLAEKIAVMRSNNELPSDTPDYERIKEHIRKMEVYKPKLCRPRPLPPRIDGRTGKQDN